MIGRMRRRAEVQTLGKTAAGSGAQTQTFATVSTVWCALSPISGSAYIGTVNGDAGDATHRVTMRAGEAVIDKDRWLLIDGTRRFRIRGVRALGDDRTSGGYVEATVAEERTV